MTLQLCLKASQILQFHDLPVSYVKVDALHQGTDYVQHVTVGQCGGVGDFFCQFVDAY